MNKQKLRILLYSSLVVLLISCNQQKNNKTESLENGTESNTLIENHENFDWLVGSWERISKDDEKRTFENWKKETNNKLLGHGFVMMGLDTVWQEIMTLSKHDSVWVLEVKTPENDDLTQFGLTEYDSISFTVENPQHDFPKKIKYWINEGKLKAKVSGDENEIYFEFERIKTNPQQ